MSASKTLPDSRRAWKKKADIRARIIAHLEATISALEAERKKLLADRAGCTCQSKDSGHGN